MLRKNENESDYKFPCLPKRFLVLMKQSKYINLKITKINLDNQSYLNQLYENNTCFFNIPLVHAKNPRRNKKVTVQSPLNQFSETLGFFFLLSSPS